MYKAMVKAVIGFLFINTVTAFAVENRVSVEETIYLDALFKSVPNEILLTDEIKKLDITGLIKESEDPLTLNIYASNIAGWQDIRQINNLPERLDFFSKARLTSHRATLLKIMAIYDVIQGRLESAKQKFENALFLYQLIRDDRQVAIISRNLSRINYVMGNTIASLENNRLAIRSFRHLDDAKNLMSSLLWENDLLIREGQFRQAEDQLLRQMLLLSYRTKSKTGEWQCYYQLGKLYLKEKKYVESKWFFVQALILSERRLSVKEQIRSFLMLAKVKVQVKDYQLALADLKQAKSLSRNNCPVFNIDVSKDMASLYFKMRNKPMAEEYWRNFETEKEKYVGEM